MGERADIDAEAIVGHRLRVFRFILKSVGRVADAEDLAQRTLVTAMETRAQFRGEFSLTTWLFGIAVNHMRAHQRGRRRDDAVAGEGALAALAWRGDDPEAALSRRREALRLDAAIGRLPPDMHEVVVLVSLEGLSYQEAGLALGVPVGTVRSRLSRAKQTLRRDLAEAGPLLPDAPGPEADRGSLRRPSRKAGFGFASLRLAEAIFFFPSFVCAFV